MLLSLERFGIADAEQIKTLEKRRALYRQQNRLDIFGKAEGLPSAKMLTAVIHKCDKPTIRPRDRVCRVWYWKSKSMVRAGRRESAHI